jgi:hypothetical protein
MEHKVLGARVLEKAIQLTLFFRDEHSGTVSVRIESKAQISAEHNASFF